MGLTLPNPTSPTNGQSLDATPILQNINAITSAIQSFDGSQISSKSVVEAALADAINPRLRGSETQPYFIASGCVWSADSAGSTLAGSMTAGVIYINGYRQTVSSISAHAFTASKDTYVDVDYLGNITYSEVTNNSAAPTLASNSIRLAIICTGSGNIAASTSINQGDSLATLPTGIHSGDSIGNIIHPKGPGAPRYTQNSVKFNVYRSAAQNAVSGFSVLQCDTKRFDTGSNVDIVTNKGRFTAPIAGFYQFSAAAGLTITGTGYFGISLFKNGTRERDGGFLNTTAFAANTDYNATFNDILQLSAGDYIEAQIYCDSTRALDVANKSSYFSGFLVSAS